MWVPEIIALNVWPPSINYAPPFRAFDIRARDLKGPCSRSTLAFVLRCLLRLMLSLYVIHLLTNISAAIVHLQVYTELEGWKDIP